MSAATARGRVWAITAVIGAAVLWSTSYAVTKVLLDNVDAVDIGTIRFTGAALILAVLMYVRRPAARPGPRDRIAMAAGGLLGITAYFTVENIGVDMATAADAALIVASYPLLAALTEMTVSRRRVDPRQWAGMGLAIIGAVLITGHAAEDAPQRLLGDLLLLFGGVLWSFYSVVTKSVGARHGALTATYYQTVAGAAGFALISVVKSDFSTWRMPSGLDLSLLGYLAVACSVSAFLLYNYGLQRLSTATTVNILNLVPVCGVLSALLINGEQVGVAQLLGGAIVIGGVLLGLFERERPHVGEAVPATLERPKANL